MSKNISRLQWMVGGLCLVVAVLVAFIVLLLMRQPVAVTNFEQCKEAGGAILESYPEQCLIDGATFINSTQQLPGNTDEFIGMAEKDALHKAEQSNTPARVVERDGEALSVTMDFTYWRHNFYIRDGVVYKVEVEGLSTNN